MSQRLGKLPAELIALPWFDFLLAVRCMAENDEQIARLVAELSAGEGLGFFPILDVTQFAGGVLGAMVPTPAEGAQDTQTSRSPTPDFKMNEVKRV